MNCQNNIRHTLSPRRDTFKDINHKFSKSATCSVSKVKRTFSQIQKEKEQLASELKELRNNVELIFNQFIEDITNGDEFWKELLDITLEDKLDCEDLIPRSLNNMGDYLFENSKFWFLFIQGRYSDPVYLSLDEMLRLFNVCLDYDQDDIRLVYNLFLEIMKDYPIEEVIKRIPEEKAIILETFREYHYKYLLDKCHLFLMLDIESPQKSSVYNVELYNPSSKKKIKIDGGFKLTSLEYNIESTINNGQLGNDGKIVLNSLVERNKGLLVKETKEFKILKPSPTYEGLVPEVTENISYIQGIVTPQKELASVSVNPVYSYNKSRRVTNVFLKRFQTDTKQPEPFIVMNRSISFSYTQNFTFEGSPVGLTTDNEDKNTSTLVSNKNLIGKFLEDRPEGIIYKEGGVVNKTYNNLTEPDISIHQEENSIIKPRVSLFQNNNYEDIDNLINDTFNLNTPENKVKTLPVLKPQIQNNTLYFNNLQIDQIPISNIKTSPTPSRLVIKEQTKQEAQPIIEDKVKDKRMDTPVEPESSKDTNRRTSVNNIQKKGNKKINMNKSSMSYSADISADDDEDYLFYSKKQKERRRTKK
jgi:hypothetical protein